LSRPKVLAGLSPTRVRWGWTPCWRAEIGKLATVRSLGLTDLVFAETSARIVASWRARAAGCTPRTSPPALTRRTLLAALCWTRRAELVDGLVELLIGLIHRINARAERQVCSRTLYCPTRPEPVKSACGVGSADLRLLTEPARKSRSSPAIGTMGTSSQAGFAHLAHQCAYREYSCLVCARRSGLSPRHAVSLRPPKLLSKKGNPCGKSTAEP
jgi:hypothetical protein